MNPQNHKVLVIATSRKTRGGITSVVKAHAQGEQWKAYHCKWIETQIDRNILTKLFYLVTSFFQFIFLVPFYDIVHVHTATCDCATLKSPFVFISKLLRKKVVIHLHIGNQVDEYIDHWFFNYILRSADHVIVLSYVIKDKIRRLYNVGNKMSVIYNPCLEINFTSYLNRKKQILFAGILNKNKGYEDLINAFALLAVKYPEWKVIFAGNGEIENAKALVINLKIQNQVEFKGWITGEEKDILFKDTSVLCLASYEEGFPMAVIDAWSYGIPVVCTPVGGLPDIVKNGENALIFNCGDIENLAIQLEKLISDENLRNKIAKESIILCETIFKLVNINKQIGDLYESLFEQIN